MKKILLLLTLSTLLVACNSPKPVDSFSSSQEQEEIIPISIKEDKSLKIYGGTSVSFDVETNPIDKSIRWSIDKNDIASIENNTFTFIDVNEEVEAIISAYWEEDSTKRDEIKVKIYPNPIDIKASNNFEPLTFNKEGINLTNPNEKIIFKNDFSDTFIYKATFNPKLDLNGQETFGFYLYDESSSISEAKIKIHVDGRPIFKLNGYPYLYVEKEEQIEKIVLPHTAAFKDGEDKSFGIAKYKDNLYIFGEGNETFYCVENLFEQFEESSKYKVGIYTDGFKLNVKDFYVSEDKNNILFGQPTLLFPMEQEKTVYQEDEFIFRVRGNVLNYDPSKLTYSSSDNEKATIDENGKVTALLEGEVTLTAEYDNQITTSMILHIKKLIKGSMFLLDKDNVPNEFGENISILDNNDNPIRWNYSSANKVDNKHASLSIGGYIQNVDPLNKLTIINVKGNGTIKLFTGFEAYTRVKNIVLSGELQTFEFDLGVLYFKVEAVTDCIIELLSGEYKNDEVVMPEITYGLPGSPVYDASHWNRLVHDVDLSKDFTYSLIFYEKTDQATRTSRPSFWAYPADNAYDDNDDIITTGNPNYYFQVADYYKIRQDNFQCLQAAASKTEIAITTSNNSVFNDGVDVKSSSDVGFIGGGSTPMARITRDCKVEVIFKLENKVNELDVAYQEWTVTMKFDSVSKVNGTDYSGHYEQVYKATSTSGNVFKWNKMGIAMGLNESWLEGNNSHFTILGASSIGLR